MRKPCRIFLVIKILSEFLEDDLRIVFLSNEDVFPWLKLWRYTPVVWLPFLSSWIINEFENLGEWSPQSSPQSSPQGKQNSGVTCPMDKVEFKYFSSPVGPKD